MKEQIETALAALVGRSLIASARVGDIETFDFGDGSRASHALQVRCPWRLSEGSAIVTGYDDVRYPTGANPSLEPPGFRWDEAGANRRDARLQQFFLGHRAEPAVVAGVEADEVGSLQLTFDYGVRLDLFPDDSLDDVTDSERWRFFAPGTDGPHFLVTGGGCDTVVG
jgi:hypothetical protein